MTILPTKRPGTNVEESNDVNQQNGTSERNARRRDDIAALQIANLSEKTTASRRSPNSVKDRYRKQYKKSHRPRDRERDREQKREVRREQKRDRISKRENVNEVLHVHENSANSASVDPVAVEPACNNENVDMKEYCSGYNSEDEYDESPIKERHLTDEEWQERDNYFSRCISNMGYEIKQMNDDGACLFRSISDQVYGDQDHHYQVRQDCMNYIENNRDYFGPYVIENFDNYVARKRLWNVHGNHLEIQAMSELYNRTIEVYCYQIEPINIFNRSRIINSYEPIRLSYHRMSHYNSIRNPNKPSVGVGLGLPNYHTTVDINRRRINEALRASDQLLIEQTMLEDKLKATDWEATNEAMEEQVARESYIQYFRDNERRLKAQGHPLASGSSSNLVASPRCSRRGSVSPKGCQSPKGSSSASPKNSFSTLASPRTSPLAATNSDTVDIAIPAYVPTEEESAFAKRVYNSPRRTCEQVDICSDFNQQPGPSSLSGPNLALGDVDQEIMAQVLAESQTLYLAELKKKMKNNACPGPSTSS